MVNITFPIDTKLPKMILHNWIVMTQPMEMVLKPSPLIRSSVNDTYTYKVHDYSNRGWAIEILEDYLIGLERVYGDNRLMHT